MAVRSLTREQLHALVWRSPMLEVARGLSVSSSYLKRVCDRMQVPCPPRGYWSRRRHGYNDPPEPLPPPAPGCQLSWEPSVGATNFTPIPPVPNPSPRKLTAARKRARGRHALVAEATEGFSSASLSREGFLKPTSRRLLDLYVGPDALPRALRTMNFLLKTLEDHGLSVRMAKPSWQLEHSAPNYRNMKKHERPRRDCWHPVRPTVAATGTLYYGVQMFELAEERELVFTGGSYKVEATLSATERRRVTDDAPRTKRYVPTGRLAFRAYSPYPGVEWEQVWTESGAALDLSNEAEGIAKRLNTYATRLAKSVRGGMSDGEWKREARAIEALRGERNARDAYHRSGAELRAAVARWGEPQLAAEFLKEVETGIQERPAKERAKLRKKLDVAKEMLSEVGTGEDAMAAFLAWKEPDAG